MEFEDHMQTLLWFSLTKENVEEIKKMEFKNLKIDLTSILCKIKVCEIENFEKFVELNMQEKVTRIPKVIYNHQIQLHFVKKWAMMRSDIRGGAFLSTGLLILTDSL